jgi:hypothetical protein
MRKVVSPRTGSSSTQLKRSPWGSWLETLEERRLLAATPTLFKLDDPGPRVSASARSAKVHGPAAPTSAFTTAALTQTLSGALTGRFVFTSGGHGWKGSGTSYTTDRPEYWRDSDADPNADGNLVEDFGNQDQMTLFADYVLRAGGTVIPMRPVGRQVNEVVVDNDSAAVTFTGSWSNSSGTQYYDEDYGAVADAVPYRFAATTAGAETSVATYTPNIPQAGFYPVYTWVARSANRTTQLYRINHSGGSTELRVDHRKVGFGWVYLGTYHFNSGSSATAGSVQISNNSSVAGNVIADAIRFGNGMGDYIASGATVISGKPREDENSYHWIARMVGQGTSLDTAIGAGASNVSAPSNMARWMFSGTAPVVGAGSAEAVYIGIHSNGSTGDVDTATGRGARGLMTTTTSLRTQNQAALALYMGRQINTDFQALNGVFEYNWTTSTTHTASNLDFGEIDMGPSAEMDATIVEVGFHDNLQDNAILRDPKGRDQIARSILQGTIEYFQNHGGLTNTTSLPTAPNTVRAVSNNTGELTVNWAAGASTPAGVYGAAATGFNIYTSTDGYGFSLASTVGNVTSATISGFDPAVPLYIKVTAINSGGESLGSEVMTALPSGGAKDILVVSGFDRYGRDHNFRYAYADNPDGLTDRVWSRYNNSFDYVVQVASAIQAARPGAHVASTSNEAVISGAVNLNDYDKVIWILGSESTVNDTFNATEQTKVEQFIANGGHLFLSGSNIAWDLDAQNNGDSFVKNTLGASYVVDDAGTYTAVVAAGGIFAGLSSSVFSNGSAYSQLDGQLYNVTDPDVLAVTAGSVVAMTYSGGANAGTTAAIQRRGTGGRGNVVMLAFPFEAMTNATRRTQVMSRVLGFFSPTGVPDLVAGSDSGSFNNDNLTNLDNSSNAKRLTFDVPGTTAGATVTIYADGVAIGSAVAAGDTTSVTTNGTTDLVDGTRVITARQTLPGLSESPDSASLSITIDTLAPAAPPAPDLDSASDSGADNTDNRTNDNTPTFTGTFPAPPTAIPLTLYRDGVAVGNTNAGSTWSIATAQQADGTYAFTTTIDDAAGNTSVPSTALSVTIDTAAPAADVVDVSPDPRTSGVASINVVFNEAVAGLDAGDFDLTRNGGADLLTGSESVSSNDGGITWMISGLSALTSQTGTYALTVNAGAGSATDVAGNSLAVPASDTWVNNDALPTVANVFVNGTGWLQDFRDYLATSGQGDATLGYRLDATAHADELPWTNLNQISVKFSEDVTLSTAAAFRVFGVAVGEYAGGFTYNATTFTATWTLAAAGTFANADKLLVRLDDALVSDANGNALDGEWTNPPETDPVTAGGSDSFPSGDGTAGGDFAFRLNVLPGDVNRSGTIFGNDVTLTRNAQGSTPGDGIYSIFRDVNGSATIFGNDVTLVRNRQGTTLPEGTPVPLP